ncbi:MAG: GntR family transcriptional regulator [Spirochaetes bacterium]|nr:GntR family transcriptional regulator [Spirochaetota bacterium]
MMSPLKKNSETPLYVQVEEKIKELIGDLDGQNKQLPTEKELCDKFKISRVTVRKAIDNLVKNNVLVRTTGKGTFVKTEDKNRFLRIGVAINKLSSIGHPYLSRIMAGMARSFEKYNYNFHILCTDKKSSSLKANYFYLNAVKSKLVNGLIIVGEEAEIPDILNLKKMNYPFVLINNYMSDSTIPSIQLHNEKGAYDAVSYLIKLKHKRIAFICGELRFKVDLQRLEGYRRALHEKNIPFDNTLLSECSFDEHAAYLQTVKLLKLNNPPSAFFCSDDIIARGVFKGAAEMKKKIPGDISVVGFNDMDFAPLLKVPLTTMHLSLNNIGEKAVEMLFKIIRNEPLTEKNILIEPVLIARESCAVYHKK